METAIKKIVSDHFGVTIPSIESRSRLRIYAEPRQFAMALIREYTRLSLSQIGIEFDRDHTTVLHAIEMVKDLKFTQRRFQRQWEALCQKVELEETPFEKQLRFERNNRIKNTVAVPKNKQGIHRDIKGKFSQI